MTPERWQIIDRLLDEVLELPPSKREKFLVFKCGTDDDLRLEIQSLLKAHEELDEFIEDSAIRVIAKDLAHEKKSPSNSNFLGKTFDSYKIEKLLGEGGMGEVYLAFDEKLNRQVAVKILPSAYTADDERVSRFEREARAISALNHPNIVTIYDVGNFEDINFIATEFVKGKILREYVTEGIDLRGALYVIIQCCDALSVAHQAGIIHRDIKPENIIVRPDGYVKILDFGLAKLTDSASFDPKDFAKTAKGMIIGTPAYMSPQQISDDKLDHRTDLWSISLVLYELVTGINPFKKDTKPKTFEAILSNEPPLASSLNAEIPFELDQILAKALEKDADISYQSAADLRADLLHIKRELDSSLSHSHSSRSLSFQTNYFRYPIYLGLVTVFILTILSGSLAWYFYFRADSRANGIDWTKAINTPLTNQPGTEYFPSLAPDGESFVFAAKPLGNYDIFLKRVGGNKEINLTENSPEDDTQAAFSPDGKQIAFRSERNGGGIFVMEETGENPRRVCDFGFHPSWSPDGKQIAVSDSGFIRPSVRGNSSIWVVNIENGEKRKLVETYAYQPAWSPNGERIAFWFIGSKMSKREVATVSVDGGEPIVIPNSASANWNPVWTPDGKFLYYASSKSGNMAFWRVRIDESTGRILGDSEIVPTPGKFNAHLSFSKDGTRLIYVQMNNKSNLKAVEFDPKLGKPIGETFWITNAEQEIERPRLSPDGKEFVVNVARLTQDDIVIFDRNGKNWRDLTNDEYFDRYPNWSPDGKKITFFSDRSGSHQIWIINADGSNLRQITKKSESGGVPVWSPEGERFAHRVGTEHYIIDVKDIDNPTYKKLSMVEGLIYYDWDWSPDGTKIIGRWRDKSDITGVGYYSLETNEYIKIWTGEGTMPRWLPDSKRLIFSYKGKTNIIDINTKELREIPSLPEENTSGVGISRDGSLLYFTVDSDESNIWLLDFKEN